MYKSVSVYFRAPDTRVIDLDEGQEGLWDEYQTLLDAAISSGYDISAYRAADLAREEFIDSIQDEVEDIDLIEDVEEY